MTGNGAVTVELGQRTGWIYGHHRTIVPALKATRSPRQWDTTLRCWKVPAKYVDDICASIEMTIGGDVTVKRVYR